MSLLTLSLPPSVEPHRLRAVLKTRCPPNSVYASLATQSCNANDKLQTTPRRPRQAEAQATLLDGLMKDLFMSMIA